MRAHAAGFHLDWSNLQTAYDLEVAGQEIRSRIEKEVLPQTAA